MPRFKVERVTPDEVDILVEGRVTLHFRRIKNFVWKVGATTHDRGKATVSKKDFSDARNLAIEKMRKAAEQEMPSSKNGEMTRASRREVTDEDIARIVLRNARDREVSIDTALDVFLSSARWCDSSHRWSIMKEINKIRGAAGGAASKKRAHA